MTSSIRASISEERTLYEREEADRLKNPVYRAKKHLVSARNDLHALRMQIRATHQEFAALEEIDNNLTRAYNALVRFSDNVD